MSAGSRGEPGSAKGVAQNRGKGADRTGRARPRSARLQNEGGTPEKRGSSPKFRGNVPKRGERGVPRFFAFQRGEKRARSVFFGRGSLGERPKAFFGTPPWSLGPLPAFWTSAPVFWNVPPFFGTHSASREPLPGLWDVPPESGAPPDEKRLPPGGLDQPGASWAVPAFLYRVPRRPAPKLETTISPSSSRRPNTRCRELRLG